MAAPPSDLIAALRAGTVRRHLFFKMTHSQGTVLAWDGIRNFELDGEVYLGIAGAAAIDGVSNSGDPQNHEILVTLNGVPLSALLSIDPNVRNEVVTIIGAWITEAGVVLRQRTLFVGLGDVLRVKPEADKRALVVKARAAMADWRTPPRAYYTDADQQRRYPGDTGFKYIHELENAVISGWAATPETSGSIPIFVAYVELRDDVTDVPIGDGALGMTAHYITPFLTTWPPLTLETGSGFVYAEQGTGAQASIGGSNRIQVGGVDCYVDASGDVRTVGGNLLLSAAPGSTKLRRQGTISGNGSATGTSIQYVNTARAGGGASYNRLRLATSSHNDTTHDQSGMVYCNLNGRDVIANIGGTAVQLESTGALYVEDVTGAAVTFSGTTMQVGGSDCKISTTGVVLSPGGRRIVKSGGTAGEFLRTWT